MKIGTRSLLFGAHQFILHPILIAWSWIKLYGWSWHPLLWLSFIVHDWGYWGRAAMDSEDGENHVFLGAKIVGFFGGPKWEQFNVAHSRFWCRRMSIPSSRLCIADKYTIALHPARLYIWMTRFTGEILEYKSVQKHVDEVGQHKIVDASFNEDMIWFLNLQINMIMFVMENQDRSKRWDRRLKRGPSI